MGNRTARSGSVCVLRAVRFPKIGYGKEEGGCPGVSTQASVVISTSCWSRVGVIVNDWHLFSCIPPMSMTCVGKFRQALLWHLADQLCVESGKCLACLYWPPVSQHVFQEAIVSHQTICRIISLFWNLCEPGSLWARQGETWDSHSN